MTVQSFNQLAHSIANSMTLSWKVSHVRYARGNFLMIGGIKMKEFRHALANSIEQCGGRKMGVSRLRQCCGPATATGAREQRGVARMSHQSYNICFSISSFLPTGAGV
ncbi:hypothetical protein LCM4579_24910 [Ensifer sp. LCM 4579]|nr:hypothetical protein LCM4579_24910 [Ensifer sp. LCM 4579]